ncbi:MAG: DUF3160 domain-containing protein [Lachnospiraceae bacterium]|nr:DUF3160 domain-containing protein [Lachnospiraceae bacterium]
MRSKRIIAFFLSAVMLLSFTGCGDAADIVGIDENLIAGYLEDAKKDENRSAKISSDTFSADKPQGLERISLIKDFFDEDDEEITPNLAPYKADDDFGNVYNYKQFYLNKTQMEMLKDNYFYLSEWGPDEFFETYEDNRYMYVPNFVTVDSMMHTYHLYFAYLQRCTEEEYLYDSLCDLTEYMLLEARDQYTDLEGTEWEEAAKINLCFFSVADCLLNGTDEIDPMVTGVGEAELELIMDEAGIDMSPLLGIEEDYSQYRPRGYYENDEDLQKYFRTRMWYGRRNFTREDPEGNDVLDRSALLMTMAMKDEALEEWEKIYKITSFFTGDSDDSGYYEYKPIIDAVYGENAGIPDIIGQDEKYAEYHRLTGELERPKINSVVLKKADSKEDKEKKSTGFRFMGQRFSIDEAVFQQLVYDRIGEDASGNDRMLPDALDVPAALGNETALSILEDMGETGYEGYMENMEKLQDALSDSGEDTWKNSLYSAWLYTLRPLLTEKKEGYPSFMQTEAWNKKDLATFLGSYSELKHDTILYSKQMMAELGGGEIDEYDDRGYVEPEVTVYARLNALVNATKEGLLYYDVLSDESEDDLDILAELSESLLEISKKELKDEVLTDEEYDLIRCYGGQIEHFWQVANRREAGRDEFSTDEFPAAIIADVATDPNGAVLEVGTGNPREINVLVEVDGKIKIAVGTVYSFHEFSWPISDRLTDSKWRQMLGIEVEDWQNYEPYEGPEVELPYWEDELVYHYNPDDYTEEYYETME